MVGNPLLSAFHSRVLAELASISSPENGHSLFWDANRERTFGNNKPFEITADPDTKDQECAEAYTWQQLQMHAPIHQISRSARFEW
jgi:hypothetical protein